MEYIRRFTCLPILLDMLINRQIALVNPSLWEDRNDSYFIEVYRDKMKFKSILALCFTTEPEQFHHWKVFAGNHSGVCVMFEKADLLKAFLKDENIEYGMVEYRLMKDLRVSPPAVGRLPYIKRKHYEDEGEFRILYRSKDEEMPVKIFSMDLGSVRRITLSPWIPSSVRRTMVDLIHGIPGCSTIKVIKTGVIEWEPWKKIAHTSI